MTDKIQKARRAAFEDWTKREHGNLDLRKDGEYFDDLYHGAWLGFNAALDCVVIELGKGALASDGHEWMPVSAFRAAIESTNLGLRVK